MYVVITGASRGIGLELTRIALVKGHHVLAVARRPEDSPELMGLKDNHDRLEFLTLDLVTEGSQKRIAEKVRTWPRVDVLINNAGIYEKDDREEDFEKSFLTNSIKPFFITQALLSKLRDSEKALSLQISSQMGSIGNSTSGGSYSYRASKTALNMIFKSLSMDEKWLTILLVHPGWVQTRMGGQEAPLKAQDSALGIWNLIEKSSLSQTGSFLTYKGEKLLW